MVRKKERKDEAVSPVIGVILMVAITVILAAVIGSFVFGFSGKLTEAPPQFHARLDKADDSEEALYITHTGGDVVDLKDIQIVVRTKGTSITFDPASSGGSYVDAFGAQQQMKITLSSGYNHGQVAPGAVTVDGNDCGAVVQYESLTIDELEEGYTVEVTFIHKPTGQIVLELSGVVTP